MAAGGGDTGGRTGTRVCGNPLTRLTLMLGPSQDRAIRSVQDHNSRTNRTRHGSQRGISLRLHADSACRRGGSIDSGRRPMEHRAPGQRRADLDQGRQSGVAATAPSHADAEHIGTGRPGSTGCGGRRVRSSRGRCRARAGEIDVSGAASAPDPYHVDLARSDGRCRQAAKAKPCSPTQSTTRALLPGGDRCPPVGRELRRATRARGERQVAGKRTGTCPHRAGCAPRAGHRVPRRGP